MKALVKALFLSCVLCLPIPVMAENYSLDWSTVDGGGGTSTGGVYTVSGTIGQPDAGAMSGGNYSLTGGFWGIIAAVATPGAPLLAITRTTGNAVVVSWPSPSTGWVLQQSGDLNLTNWTDVLTVTDDGTHKSLTMPAPVGNRYYRLRKE
jgi:hypothetical protein